MTNTPYSLTRRSSLNVMGLAVSTVVASFVADAVRAQTAWTGETDADWNNPANWSDGVPADESTAIISRDLEALSGDPNQPLPLDNQPILDGGSGAAEYLYLGSLAGAELTVQNGGSLTTELTFIGANAKNPEDGDRVDEQSGTLNVTGAGSSFDTEFLDLGYYGTGTAIISDGAKFEADGAVVMSSQDGSTSTLSFDGTGTTGLMEVLIAGASGNSTVSVTNGAEMTTEGATLGQRGIATVEVSGAGSRLTVSTNSLTLGSRFGGEGILSIRDGGTVTAGGRVTVGRRFGTSGTVTIDGADSTLDASETVVLGFALNSTGTASVTDGGTLEANEVLLGWFFGGNGALEASGAESRIAVKDYLMAGFLGNGVVTLSDGATLEAVDPSEDTVLSIARFGTATGTVNIGAARDATATGAGHVTLDRVSFGSGEGELVFNHNSEGYKFGAAISGSGTLSHLAGDTTLSGDSIGFTGTTNVEGGRLRVTGALGGEINVSNSGRLGGSGTVSSFKVGVGASLEPEGTLTVEDNARFEAGSDYLVDADSEGSDLVSVTGTLNLNGGMVRHRGSTVDFDPTSRYRIAEANAGVTGEFDGVTTNLDLAFLDPELSYTEKEVWLDLLRNDTEFTDIAISSNQLSLGAALSGLDLSEPVMEQILAMSAASARQAYDQLAGEVHASTASAAIQDAVLLQEMLLKRLRQGRDESSDTIVARNRMSASPVDATVSQGAWMEGFGSWSDFDGDGNASGTRRDMDGFVFGYEHKMANGLHMGAMASYSNSSIRNDIGASSDVDNVSLGLYLSTGRDGPGLRLSGGALINWHDVETTRSLSSVGTGAALGRYDANSYSLFVETGYELRFDNSAIEPFFGLAHVGYESDDFVETDSANALTVPGISTETTFATLGLRGAMELDGGDQRMIATGMLGWRHAFGDTDPAQNALLLGNAFTAQGMPIAENELLIEAGLDMLMGHNSMFSVTYSGRLADGFADHGLRVGLNVSF